MDKRQQLIDIVEGNNYRPVVLEIVHKKPTRREFEERQKICPLIYIGTFADEEPQG